jgi:hypothetical protein
VPAKPTEKPRKSALPRPARRHVVLTRSDTRFAAPPVARFVPTKTVGSFVPALTKKAFEKFGFSTASLVTDWARIVGADLASYTVPERLKWPRCVEVIEDEADAQRGATLTLRVDPARALDVEYRARQILDRINSYFGYRAIESVRLVQAPLAIQPVRKEAARRQPSAAAEAASADPLLAALARMEQGIRRDRTSGA